MNDRWKLIAIGSVYRVYCSKTSGPIYHISFVAFVWEGDRTLQIY